MHWFALVCAWYPATVTVPEPIRAAVEEVECRGDLDAVSSAGCVGPMQVCPRWSIVSRDVLLDHSVNRLEGTRMLAYWHRRAHKNWRRALAAYNCGNAGLRGKCGKKYAAEVLRLADR